MHLLFVLGLALPSANANPIKCYLFFKSGVERVRRVRDDLVWRAYHPTLPLPRQLAKFRENLAADTATVLGSFHLMVDGEFKATAAASEIERLAGLILSRRRDLHPASYEAWSDQDDKNRMMAYNLYLGRLLHGPKERASLEKLPIALITRAAKAMDLAEEAGAYSFKQFAAEHVPYAIERQKRPRLPKR